MQDRLALVIFPTCPHCNKHDVAFYYSSSRVIRDTSRAVYFFTCGSCWRGVCFEADSYYTSNLHDLKYSSAQRVYPEAEQIEVPGNTPENIGRHYKTAVKNLDSGTDGDYEAAGIMARKALEAAVNSFGASGVSLYAKIESLAAAHVISKSLAQWAHEIRDIGNNAAHGDEPFTKDDAEQTVFFTEMLLTYLYTLPAMIEQRREK